MHYPFNLVIPYKKRKCNMGLSMNSRSETLHALWPFYLLQGLLITLLFSLKSSQMPHAPKGVLDNIHYSFWIMLAAYWFLIIYLIVKRRNETTVIFGIIQGAIFMSALAVLRFPVVWGAHDSYIMLAHAREISSIPSWLLTT